MTMLVADWNTPLLIEEYVAGPSEHLRAVRRRPDSGRVDAE